MVFSNAKKFVALLCLVIFMCSACGKSGSPFMEESMPATIEPVPGETAETQLTPKFTMEQAMDILYENHIDAELFYTEDSNKIQDNALLYCFEYDDGDKQCYVWINSVTGEAEFADENED